MEHKYIISDKGTTHYWIKKNTISSKCIVFTHGVTADHSLFEKQIEYFSSKYTVLNWDVPFHGLSRPYQDFSYKQTAIELKSILDEERITKAVLVGMSMGGYPCQMFIDMYPEMAECFIALDTTPFGTAYYSKSDLWWLKKVKPMAEWFPEGVLRKSMAKSVSLTEYSYNTMLEMLKPLSKAQIIEQMDIAYGKFAQENRDIDLSVPVLILLGDKDKTGKVSQYCKEWSRKTGYPLHIIKNAAHFSNGDNPEQVNNEIEEFILRIEY